MLTYADTLHRVGVTVPDHLEEDMTVPLLTGLQRQGDLLIRPVAEVPFGDTVPREGIQLVVGEATGNTHWLHAVGDVTFRRGAGQIVGYMIVPETATAYVIHTDEHGANGVGAGSYEIRRAREAATRSMVAD